MIQRSFQPSAVKQLKIQSMPEGKHASNILYTQAALELLGRYLPVPEAPPPPRAVMGERKLYSMFRGLGHNILKQQNQVLNQTLAIPDLA